MQIFISYSIADKDFASRLCNDLILYDIEVWFDEWSIKPGDSIPGAIESGLRSSDFVLLLLTKNAILSDWVSEELNTTLYSSISKSQPKLIPLMVESCSLPSIIAHRKYIDFSNSDNYENSLNDLITFLHKESKRAFVNYPFIPGFKEIKFLGEGGFATVYKGLEISSQSRKAIKIPKGRRKLEPEVAIMKKLGDHHGIVPIERTFFYKNKNVLVMPYSGHSLKWYIEHKKIRPNQIEQIVVWIEKLLEILSYAHSKGIIHRDIKPSNILIDEYGDIRICDFGIAQKIHYVEFQHTTIVRGTLCYMSPEQQLAENITERSDIYSVGAVFYELLTGEKPVGRFRNPRFYNNEISFRLEGVINKCLERDPSDRYETAGEALKDLKKLLSRPNIYLEQTKIIGKSTAMKEVIESAKNAASFPDPVVIVGETGTGKELIARLIYEEYAKKMGDEIPFFTVNLAAIPEVLLESTLFGHTKGAFTGAISDNLGYFEAANGGVLFLDEIGQLSSESQGKLLRVLSEKEIRRIGSTTPKKVNFKAIFATNQSLEKMVEAGTFRRDLFYRISNFKILLPPLRERKEDIPELINYFLEISSQRHMKTPARFTNNAINLLKDYYWPGNVRELHHTVEFFIIMQKSEIIRLKDVKEFISKRGVTDQTNAFITEFSDLYEENSIIAINGCDKKYKLSPVSL